MNDMAPCFIFTQDKAEIRGGNLYIGEKEHSDFSAGLPTEDELLKGRHLGFRYCNMIWVEPPFNPVALDHLDLYRYFWSK
jgi:hypothetical protein